MITILRCNRCGHEAPAEDFAYGDRREMTHPEHRYCPNPSCRCSIDWFGFTTRWETEKEEVKT